MVDGDGRSRVGGVAARPAAVASCGGGAPAALGSGVWVVEHRWEVMKLVGESIWIEGGRKREFRGGRRWRRLCPGELRWPERTEEGAGEHQWEVGIPFPGSVGAEGGRR